MGSGTIRSGGGDCRPGGTTQGSIFSFDSSKSFVSLIGAPRSHVTAQGWKGKRSRPARCVSPTPSTSMNGMRPREPRLPGGAI